MSSAVVFVPTTPGLADAFKLIVPHRHAYALHTMLRAGIVWQTEAGTEGNMVGRKFQDIWKEQCEAARGVREQHGVVAALDYLIGEKLMTYAETAVTRSEFARELPRFVGEIRNIFSAEEIRLFTEHLERMDAQEDEAVSAKPADDDMMIETPEQRAAARDRLARLKELLTASVLGTG